MNIIEVTDKNRKKLLARFPDQLFDRPSDQIIDQESVGYHLRFFAEDSETIYAVNPAECILFYDFATGDGGVLMNPEKEEELIESI